MDSFFVTSILVTCSRLVTIDKHSRVVRCRDIPIWWYIANLGLASTVGRYNRSAFHVIFAPASCDLADS